MLDKYSESEVHVDLVEEKPTSSIAFGLERMGLIAIKVGHKLNWDPDKERFVNDNDANAMLAVPERDWQKNYGR